MDRFAARRKILRGSLSAPLILTIASPAMAARQSFEACLARAEKERAKPSLFIGAADHDTWLRKPVKIYKGILSTTGKVTQVNKVTGNETGSYFYELVGREGLLYPVDACSLTGYPPNNAPGNSPELVERQQTLVFVDASGSIAGFGPCPDGGFPVTTSCWASFGGMMQL